MNSRLKDVRNWSELAKAANWSASGLACITNVSLRTLEHYFQEEFRKTPRNWLVEQRQIAAMQLFHNGASVKEASAQLGYSCSNHLSRDFKKHWGFCPGIARLRVLV